MSPKEKTLEWLSENDRMSKITILTSVVMSAAAGATWGYLIGVEKGMSQCETFK